MLVSIGGITSATTFYRSGCFKAADREALVRAIGDVLFHFSISVVSYSTKACPVPHTYVRRAREDRGAPRCYCADRLHCRRRKGRRILALAVETTEVTRGSNDEIGS